jgi:hypothetical protein
MDRPVHLDASKLNQSAAWAEECVRRALASAPADYLASVHADCGIEYVFDGKHIAESKVFGTDSQKGN